MVSNITNFNIQKTNLANLYPNLKDSSVSMPVIPPPAQEDDSTHFTSKQKSKDQSFVQKHWGKMLLGAAAITVGAILTKGKLWGKQTLEHAQKNLSEIFRKDISKEEAVSMLKKYQEILKIEDKNEFITQLFHQVKKDYGYENINVKLDILDKPVEARGTIKGAAVYRFSKGEIGVLKTRSKEEIFSSLPHEFNHMRQEEYMYLTSPEKMRTSLVEKTIDALKNDESHKNNLGELRKEAEKFADEQMDSMSKRWGGRSAFSSDSKQYKLGQKYIESHKKYINDNKKAYDNDFNEQEAHKIGDLMQEIARYIESNK